MQAWGKRGAQKGAASSVWGDGSEEISRRQDQLHGHTTSVSGPHAHKCSCLGFNALWSPFEILNIVALSLKCVFCRCSSMGQWACTRGLEPQLSAAPPSSASPSPQEGLSAAHPQTLEPGGSEPCRGRPAYCHHPPSRAETRHRSKEGQGQACAPQCLGVGQGGSCPCPALAAAQAHCLGPLSHPQFRYQECPVQRRQSLGLG